jgi:hypothetical protein
METRFATSLAILVLIATVAGAQETAPAPKPDYSRENLQRFVAAIPAKPKHERNFRFYWGAVEFNALGQRFRLGPVMPFSGTQLGVTQTWPDPFSLTGTVIATPKRAWRTQRKVNAEMRRIEKTERAKIKVKLD